MRRTGSIQVDTIEIIGGPTEPRNWIAVESAMAVSVVSYVALAIGLVWPSVVVVYLAIAGSIAAGVVLVIAVLRGRASAKRGDAGWVATLSREASPRPRAPAGPSPTWSPPAHARFPTSQVQQATEGCDTMSTACTPLVVTAALVPGTWSATEVAGDLRAPGAGVMGRLRRHPPPEPEAEMRPAGWAGADETRRKARRPGGEECATPTQPRSRSTKNGSVRSGSAPVPAELNGGNARTRRGPSGPASPRTAKTAGRSGAAPSRRTPRSTGPKGSGPSRTSASR